MKHKHHDCIVAWAAGAVIQVRPPMNGRFESSWVDFSKHEVPLWIDSIEYRVKSQPDPYAELKAAFAEGKTIQYRYRYESSWFDETNFNWSSPLNQYRIKPETKPDFIMWGRVRAASDRSICFNPNIGIVEGPSDNIKCTFDGETGKLKAVELL